MIRQLDLFEAYFNPVDYEWEPMLGSSIYRMCDAEIYIPENVFSPLEITEKTGLRYPSKKHEVEIDRWSAHVHAIGNCMPRVSDWWSVACRLLKKHRENREPIKVRINSGRIRHFLETSVVKTH